MSIERTELEAAIRTLREPGITERLAFAGARDTVIAAAEAHLATLPEERDHVVVGVCEDLDVFLYEAFGEKRFTADKAQHQAAVARKDWPHVVYTVVKVKP